MPPPASPFPCAWGSTGPFVQLGSRDDEEKPRFASLMPGQRMDDVTLEDALRLLSLPRELGEMPSGEAVSVGRGQFGPYVKYGTKFASIKEDDPFTLTLERAIEIVEAKKKADAERSILQFPEAGISVLDGRFGPYATDGKKNAKVPRPPTITKDTDADTKARLWRAAASKLTLDECRELIAAAPEAKGRFGRRGARKKQVAAGRRRPNPRPNPGQGQGQAEEDRPEEIPGAQEEGLHRVSDRVDRDAVKAYLLGLQARICVALEAAGRRRPLPARRLAAGRGRRRREPRAAGRKIAGTRRRQLLARDGQQHAAVGDAAPA